MRLALELLAIVRGTSGFPAVWHGADSRGCKDKHSDCASWAAHGQCKENTMFMKQECAMSCHSCGWVVGDMVPADLRASEKEQDHIKRRGSHGTCSGQVQVEALSHLTRGSLLPSEFYLTTAPPSSADPWTVRRNS